MYVTRKVFSAREEDIIAAIEERAFCAGYEQRMFDEAEEEGGLTENQKLGLAAAGATGITGAGMYGLSKVNGRGAIDKTESFFRHGVEKIQDLFDGRSAKDKVKGAAKDSRNAVIDAAENLGKKIKNAWSGNGGKGIKAWKKNAKGRAALGAIALGAGAATVGGKKGVDYIKSRRNSDED